MFDLFKSVVRWVTGDPQAMQNVRLRMMTPNEYESYRRNHLDRPFEERVAEGLDPGVVWREQQRVLAEGGMDPETMNLQRSEDNDGSFRFSQDVCKQRIGQAAKFNADKDKVSVAGPATRLQGDRERMPPPPTPSKITTSNVQRSPRQTFGPTSTYNGSVAARTMPSTSSRALLAGLQDTEQEERAKRYAEALEIPADSGLWYQSESGLYFHLGLRGMEALLPAAWMVDFKTFPLGLFEHDLEADCLIRNIYGPQFRAIRALRELVETANRVRDLIQARHKMVKIQSSLQKSLEDYLNWALTDGDLYFTSNSLPTYVIMQRKRQQPVVEAIAHLASEMHDLLVKHECFFYDDATQELGPGLVGNETTPTNNYNSIQDQIQDLVDEKLEAQTHDDSSGYDPPVILGFLIVHTTVSIFSLNARNAKSAALVNDEGRGIHMLGRFNFVETGADVWNALALAICCCHLRNGLLARAVPRDSIDGLRAFEAAMTPRPGEAMPKLDHGRVAGYVGKKDFEAARKREREVDDDGDDSREHDTMGEPVVKGKAKAKDRDDFMSDYSKGKRRATMVEPTNHGRKRMKLTVSKPNDSDPDL